MATGFNREKKRCRLVWRNKWGALMRNFWVEWRCDRAHMMPNSPSGPAENMFDGPDWNFSFFSPHHSLSKSKQSKTETNSLDTLSRCHIVYPSDTQKLSHIDRKLNFFSGFGHLRTPFSVHSYEGFIKLELGSTWMCVYRSCVVPQN